MTRLNNIFSRCRFTFDERTEFEMIQGERATILFTTPKHLRCWYLCLVNSKEIQKMNACRKWVVSALSPPELHLLLSGFVRRSTKNHVETLQTMAQSHLSGFNLPWRQRQNVVAFLIVQWSVLTHEKDMLSGPDGGPKWVIGS